MLKTIFLAAAILGASFAHAGPEVPPEATVTKPEVADGPENGDCDGSVDEDCFGPGAPVSAEGYLPNGGGGIVAGGEAWAGGFVAGPCGQRPCCNGQRPCVRPPVPPCVVYGDCDMRPPRNDDVFYEEDEYFERPAHHQPRRDVKFEICTVRFEGDIVRVYAYEDWSKRPIWVGGTAEWNTQQVRDQSLLRNGSCGDLIW